MATELPGEAPAGAGDKSAGEPVVVPRFDWRARVGDFRGRPLDEAPPEVVEYLEAYFRPFAEPPREDGNGAAGGHRCLHCDHHQLGLLLGCFAWGIAHGEGRCGHCGWPARLYHYLRFPGSDEDQRIVLLLQYHPEAVTRRDRRDAG